MRHSDFNPLQRALLDTPQREVKYDHQTGLRLSALGTTIAAISLNTGLDSVDVYMLLGAWFGHTPQTGEA